MSLKLGVLKANHCLRLVSIAPVSKPTFFSYSEAKSHSHLSVCFALTASTVTLSRAVLYSAHSTASNTSVCSDSDKSAARSLAV